MDNYFESNEFLDILADYERCRRQGEVHYFDMDAMIDIGHYFLNNHQYEDAVILADNACEMNHPSQEFVPLKIEALVNLGQIDEAERLTDEMDADEEYDYYYFKAQILLTRQEKYSKIDRLFHIWIKKEIEEIENAGRDNEEMDVKLEIREAFMHILASYCELSKVYNDEFACSMTEWKKLYVEKCAPIGEYEIDRDIAKLYHDCGLTLIEQEIYELILDTNPYIPDGWTYLASIQHMNGDYQSAVTSTEYASAIEPDNSYITMLQAHSYYMMENYELALRMYLKLAEKEENESHDQIIGKCFMMLGKYMEGQEYLARAVRKFEKHPGDDKQQASFYAFVADAFLKGGLNAIAGFYADKALQFDSELPELLMLKGEILLHLMETENAKHYFDKALENTSYKGAHYLLIGGLFLENDYTEDSLKYLLAAVNDEENPLKTKAYVYLAYAYLRLRKKILFRRYLKLACTEAPDFVRLFWWENVKDAEPQEYFDIIAKLF